MPFQTKSFISMSAGIELILSEQFKQENSMSTHTQIFIISFILENIFNLKLTQYKKN